MRAQTNWGGARMESFGKEGMLMRLRLWFQEATKCLAIG
jgi:hypothetical protein